MQYIINALYTALETSVFCITHESKSSSKRKHHFSLLYTAEMKFSKKRGSQAKFQFKLPLGGYSCCKLLDCSNLFERKESLIYEAHALNI
jgi:hypothetical protein